jgi:hypothetical protein
MLIKEVFDQFLSEQKSKLAPKTYRDYESVIDLFDNQLDGYAWNGIDDGEKAYDEGHWFRSIPNAWDGEDFCQG